MRITKEEIAKCFLCMDCNKDTSKSGEYYMLINSLWNKICPTFVERKGMLCLSCVERRLGRLLVKSDFLPISHNKEQAKVCPELRERLSR